MPYIGKPQSADPITVNTSNIDDGTIQAVDISSSFREHISGSFQGGGSNKISGSLTSTGSFGKVEVGSGKITTTGNMTLDADGAQIRLEDGGTEFGRISRVSSDLVIKSISNNNDILFKGVDGSATITALQLDMSEAGNAIFNNDVTIAGTLTAQEIHTEFTSASIVFTSGSTKFGDTIDDTHEVTGSMTMSGSVTVNDGNLTVTDNVDFNGDLDVDGTTNLDNTDIDGTLTVDGGNIVFNEDSADIDFRVEGNGDANLLFTEGETDRIGIGTNNPDGKLHIHDGSAGSVTANGDAANLVIESSATGADTGLSILSKNTRANQIFFGDEDDNDVGAIGYVHNGNYMFFRTNTSERMRIDSSGNVGIGTATPVSGGLHIHTDASTEGIYLKSEGDTRNNLVFDSNISSAADNIAFIDANWNGTNVARISMFTGTDTSNKDDGRIGFATAAAGTVAERMRIESDGRVAIKATSFPQDFGNDRGHLLISSVDDAGANNYGVLLLQGHSVADDVATGGIYFYDHNNNTATIQTQRDNSTSTGVMIFYTNGGSGVTERMRITSGGEVRVKSGDIVFDTSGAGIVLGNTSNADANTLDDYEEGTWTPVPYYQNAGDQSVAEANDSNALGRYVVVGKLVTLWGAVTVNMSSVGGITFDNFGIKGLPFSTANITNYRAVGCFAYSGNNASDEDTAFTISMGPNQNHMHVQHQDGTGNQAQSFGNGSSLELFGTISFLLP